MGKFALQLLTLFPPTGNLALNLVAVSLPMTAFLKVAAYGLGILIALYSNIIYVNSFAPILTWLMAIAPPWYIFDCIQILFDSNFNKNGFLLPLPVPLVPSGGSTKGGTDEVPNPWRLTFPLINLILATVSISGFALINQFLPQNLIDSGGKYAQYSALGGAILFGIIGVIGVLMAKNPSEIMVTLPKVSNPIAGMSGGGKISLPPLSSFIREMSSKKHDSKLNESVSFLGILGIVIVGGGILSFLRSKQQ